MLADRQSFKGAVLLLLAQTAATMMIIGRAREAQIRGAMETICFEMATHVSLTATTPILNQSNERNGAIVDAHGRLSGAAIGTPPCARIAARARRICGASGGSPIIFSAKYAFTLALISEAPS